jgi:hypothetical protein
MHCATISSTSRQFLRLFDVIIAWTTAECVVVLRGCRCAERLPDSPLLMADESKSPRLVIEEDRDGIAMIIND